MLGVGLVLSSWFAVRLLCGTQSNELQTIECMCALRGSWLEYGLDWPKAAHLASQ